MMKPLPAVSERPRFNRLTAMVLASVVAAVGIWYVIFSHAASGTRLYLTPATSSVAAGSTVTVELRENSATDAVNAVQADMSFPTTNLDFVNADATGGAFGNALIATTTTPGVLKFTYGIVGGSTVTGDQLIAKLTFKVKTGAGAITFANTSMVARSSDNTNVLNSALSTGGTLSVAVAATPVPATPTPAPVGDTAKLFLSPASASAATGSTVQVSLRENSGTNTVNAVEADLAYPTANLQYVSSDATGGAFGNPLISNTSTPGTLKFTYGIVGGAPVAGDQLLGKVTFRVLGGSGPVSFTNTSMVAQSSDSKNILTTSVGGAYSSTTTTTITPTPVVTATPAPVTPAPVGAGWMFLTPATSTVAAGSTVTVSVRENSGTDTVNAAEADLSYPTANLDYVGLDATGGAFGNALIANTGIAGSIKLTYGLVGGTPVTGDQLVTKLTFRVKAGSGTVAFDSSSMVARASDSKNILVTRTGGSYLVSGATPSPVPTATVNASPTASVTPPTPTPVPGDHSAPSVPGNLVASLVTYSQTTLSWNAATDNVGVVGYKIYRNGTLIASPTSRSFTDLGLTPDTLYEYGVEAMDASHNVSGRNLVSVRTSAAPAPVTGGGGGNNGGTPVVVTVPSTNPVTIPSGSKPTLAGKVNLTTPSSSGTSSTVAVDGSQVSSTGTLDTTVLTNGEHDVTVTSPDTNEAASTTVKVANNLTPYETVRNTLFAPLKGHPVLMNVGMIGVIVLILALGGWLLYYFLWKRRQQDGAYDTVNTNL